MIHDSEILNADILGICESWLHSGHSKKSIEIPGYEIERCDRNDNSGKGGVVAYIKSGLKYMSINLPEDVKNPGLEVLLLKLFNPEMYVLILYRSQSISKSDISCKMSKVMENIPPYSRCVVLGDINIDILSDPDQIEIQSLTSFQQIIKEATYYGGRGHQSLLDHIYIKNCNSVACGVLQTYYSDHDPIYCVININE